MTKGVDPGKVRNQGKLVNLSHHSSNFPHVSMMNHLGSSRDRKMEKWLLRSSSFSTLNSFISSSAQSFQGCDFVFLWRSISQPSLIASHKKQLWPGLSRRELYEGLSGCSQKLAGHWRARLETGQQTGQLWGSRQQNLTDPLSQALDAGGMECQQDIPSSCLCVQNSESHIQSPLGIMPTSWLGQGRGSLFVARPGCPQ